ncbi:MAG: glycosyltransferase [Pseudomonadota bacterium]|nr:glycosyltransferase [Pseudomonadota bacterium]
MLERLIEHHRHQGRYRHIVISLRRIGPVGARLQSKGVEVEAIGIMGAASFAMGFIRLVRRIRSIAPDVVQTWMYHADLIGGLAARLAGQRHIIWGVRIADISLDLGVSRSLIWSRKLCARLSGMVPQRIIYVAKAAQQVHERLGYALGKGIIVHNGYVIPDASFVVSARERRRIDLNLPPGCVLIASAGRFSPQKGYRGFVEAAAQVGRIHSDTRFLMMGREVTWQNEELAEWVRRTGMADRFHLLGERSDILEWLAAVDIFALFSIGEGFPNVVAEAMSVSVPCIVTDVGDAALLVADTGTVIEPHNREELVRAMEAMILEGAEWRRERGEAARARIQREFSIGPVAERYAELYEAIRDPGGAPSSTQNAATVDR